MPTLYLDFETYYDKEYSLRRMTPAEYILDPRYETILVAFAIDDGPVGIIDGPDFPWWIAQFDQRVTTTVTFNSMFDNAILAWRYHWVPGRMIDAMQVAKACRGHILPSASLETVLQVLNAPWRKGNAIHNMIGVNRAAFLQKPVEFQQEFKRYAAIDVTGMRWLWKLLEPEFPEEEREIMHLVLLATILPTLRTDVPRLEQHKKDEEDKQAKMLAEVSMRLLAARGTGLLAADLSSNDRFATVLELLGIEPEQKLSLTGNKIYAFAKTDSFMQDLLEHSDETIAAVAEARLGIKSTIERTRAGRMLAVAKLPWQQHGIRGNMPFPLNYAGPHTMRLSGAWKMNLQNLPRNGKLRSTILAPAGHSIVAADLSQIECRLNAWLCGQVDLVDRFRSKEDVYSALAALIFGYTVSKKTHPWERFVGKTGELGLGYGAGAPKFNSMVITSSRLEGQPLDRWTKGLAQHCVTTYRLDHRAIVHGWGMLDYMLDHAWMGDGAPARFSAVTIGPGEVALPTGLKLHYAPFKSADGLMFRYGKRVHKIYGAKFLENIVQALARCVLMQAAVRLSKLGLVFVGQVHDELIFIVQDDAVQDAKRTIYEELTRVPEWAPDIPLDCEIGVGRSYGDAK